MVQGNKKKVAPEGVEKEDCVRNVKHKGEKQAFKGWRKVIKIASSKQTRGGTQSRGGGGEKKERLFAWFGAPT